MDSIGEAGTKVREISAENCLNRIRDGFDDESPVLIDALPAMGKSSGVVKWAKTTGNPLTVFTERRVLYKQYVDWCDNEGLSVKQLPSFHHDCPTARDEDNHGDEWRLEIRAEYRKGTGAKLIHKNATDIFGEELPCQVEGNCPYMEGREYDPEDFDVLVGHYTHAYSEEPVKDRYVALDEFPGESFLSEYSGDQVANAVTEYVSRRDEIPFVDYRSIEKFGGQLSDNSLREELVKEVYGEFEHDLIGIYERRDFAHIYAPLFFRFVLLKSELENRWQFADLGNGRSGVRSPYDNSLTIFHPPTLDIAESVIGLDGTPTIEKWQMMLGSDLRHAPVFESEEENRHYLKWGLGLQIIQTTNNLKPYKSRHGGNVTVEKDMALVEAISKREELLPALISSKKAISLYEEAGISEAIGNIDTEYYGNLKGLNKFQNRRLGMVIGCPHPNEARVIQKWGALAGKSVQRETDEKGNLKLGKDIDLGPFGNALLKGERENEVLQAAMRFGREADTITGERGAKVFVHTAAIPEWVHPEKEIAEIHSWTGHKQGMRKVIETITSFEDWQSAQWTAKDVKNEIDSKYPDEKDRLSIQSVRTHLATLEEYGYLRKNPGGGRKPHVWTNYNLEECSKFGHVSFAETRSVNAA